MCESEWDILFPAVLVEDGLGLGASLSASAVDDNLVVVGGAVEGELADKVATGA